MKDTDGDDWGDDSPPAYERLLLDALQGDPTLYIRRDEVESCWEYVDEVLRGWREGEVPLREYAAGNRDYAESHPSNRAWLARHPALDADAWRRGVRSRGTTESGAPIVLELENDPLEALRLGSHVGSCLGVGGSFTYSAAAIVLDVNKRVVFAREARTGRFIACTIPWSSIARAPVSSSSITAARNLLARRSLASSRSFSSESW